MVNNGYDRQMAVDAVASGRADLVSFGRLFIANPDLVERLRTNAPLNKLMGQETFYGGGAHGYTDYPDLEHNCAAIDAGEKAHAQARRIVGLNSLLCRHRPLDSICAPRSDWALRLWVVSEAAVRSMRAVR